MTDIGSRSVSPLLSVRISGTSSVLPGPAVSTAELVERVTPRRDAARTEERTGISSRHFAVPGTSATELAALAIRKALAAAEMSADELARIIFVDSPRGDTLIPANANLVAAELDLEGTCDCFDLSNACMGFVSAFDVAARGVATGLGPVAIVASELGSRFITPEDPRPYLVLADAASAAILDRGRPGEGVLGWSLRNNGKAGTEATLAHAGITGKTETIRFGATNERMTELAVQAIKQRAAEVLTRSGLDLDDIDWVLPHQPNGAMLEIFVRVLGLDREKVVPIVHEAGSVGAASIPLSLDRLLRTRPVRPGQRILMIGVGAGLSSGAILYQVAP
jgi:3-oxoacyl-(acyl-carrier-protein) synthase III